MTFRHRSFWCLSSVWYTRSVMGYSASLKTALLMSGWTRK